MIANGLNDSNIIDAENGRIYDADSSSQDSWQKRERQGWKTYNANSSGNEEKKRSRRKGTFGSTLKQRKVVKGKGNEKTIATMWRAINWFVIWVIFCRFITFLFNKTCLSVLPYVAPGIPWTGALKMITFFFALNVAFNASAETNKDDFRFAFGVILSAIPTILMLVAGEVRLFSLFIAGCICFSVYREKIYTDSKVRRTPPRKKRRELHRTEDGNIILDEYDV